MTSKEEATFYCKKNTIGVNPPFVFSCGITYKGFTKWDESSGKRSYFVYWKDDVFVELPFYAIERFDIKIDMHG